MSSVADHTIAVLVGYFTIVVLALTVNVGYKPMVVELLKHEMFLMLAIFASAMAATGGKFYASFIAVLLFRYTSTYSKKNSGELLSLSHKYRFKSIAGKDESSTIASVSERVAQNVVSDVQAVGDITSNIGNTIVQTASTPDDLPDVPGTGTDSNGAYFYE